MKTNTILPLIIFCILNQSCNMGEINTTLIKNYGMEAEPVFLHFLSESTGYAFSNDGEMYSQSDAIIYKTTDGGRTWFQINKIENCLFTGSSSILLDNNIFCIVKNPEDMRINYILGFDHKENRIKMVDFCIEATGDFWEQNGTVLSNVFADSNYYVMAIDTQSLCYEKERMAFIAKKNGVCADNSHTYYLTHHGDLLVQNKGHIQSVPMRNPQCLFVICEGQINILANTGIDTISMYEYSVGSSQIRARHTFVGYNMAKGFRIDKKSQTIVGFLGKVAGNIVKYDMVYCPIGQQCWKTVELHNKYNITPNDVIDGHVYIFPDRHVMERIDLI